MDNILIRPIFGNPKDYKIKIGQLFDLRDECFLDSSVLKMESSAVRIFDKKDVKVESFCKLFRCEFISSIAADDLVTQVWNIFSSQKDGQRYTWKREHVHQYCQFSKWSTPNRESRWSHWSRLRSQKEISLINRVEFFLEKKSPESTPAHRLQFWLRLRDNTDVDIGFIYGTLDPGFRSQIWWIPFCLA